jgi:hypothetical protein
MRGSPGPFKRRSEDAILDFVKLLTTRTQLRAAKWEVGPCVMRTLIPGARGPLLVQFVVDPTLPRLHSWRLFTVTGATGAELMRATPAKKQDPTQPFASAVDALFFALSRTHRPPSFTSYIS